MRVIAALSVLVSAAVHLYLWLDFARDDDFLGPSFMLNAIAGAVIAAVPGEGAVGWPSLPHAATTTQSARAWPPRKTRDIPEIPPGSDGFIGSSTCWD